MGARRSASILDAMRLRALSLFPALSMRAISRELDTSENNIRRWVIPGEIERQRLIFAERNAKRRQERKLRVVPPGRSRRQSIRQAAARAGLGA
jgi:hypothetical protein